MVGTADYIAPEVLRGEPHTFRLDYWSLGVIVYELMTGALPFNADTPEEVFKNTLQRRIKYPPIGRGEGQISPEAHDFIERLLCLDPMKRLGSNGIGEIKSHAFFKDVDFKGLLDEPSKFFIPLGKDADAVQFKNQRVDDEDVRALREDQQQCSGGLLQERKDGAFRDFDDICYPTLVKINARKVADALKKASKKQKNKKK